jgi:D-glycerate 3-kinase
MVGKVLDLEKLQQQLMSAQSLTKADPNQFQAWRLLSEALAPMVVEQQLKVVAISGSQGSGKSTLADHLVNAIGNLGVSAISVSLDDYYLSRAQRLTLGEKIHPLLSTRGVPGTHDTQLLKQTLSGFSSQEARKSGDDLHTTISARLPKFNKALDDHDGFREINACVLVVEGWCLGVQAQPTKMLEETVNSLEDEEDREGIWRRWVNQQIKTHYVQLWPYIDYWIELKAPSFQQVLQWRAEQESNLLQHQRMSEVQLKRFIQHYERLTLWQWRSAKLRPGIKVRLSEDHSIESLARS